MWEDKIRGYVALDENRTFAELAEWYYSTVAPSTLKTRMFLVNYQKGIYDHIMPVIGREKLKTSRRPCSTVCLQNCRNPAIWNILFHLKDKALCDGITRQALADKAGIERSTLYTALRGNTVSRATAEKRSLPPLI